MRNYHIIVVIKDAPDTAKTETEPTLEKASENVASDIENTKTVLEKAMAFAVGRREKKSEKSNKTK
jgi:hypothetical protein